MKKSYIVTVVMLGIILSGIIFLKFNKSEDVLSKNARTEDIELAEAQNVQIGWVGENGEWYYINELTLEKESGWVEIEGETYYFDPITKVKKTGILEMSDKEWYYLDEEGRLQRNCVISNLVIDENGMVERILLTPEEQEGRKQALQPAIDEIMKNRGAVGGTVALIEGGEVTSTWEYGDAVKGSVKMTEDTKMRVASISKVIVAMNMLRMVDEGIVNLDESIGTYWGVPVYNSSYPDNPITLRSILSHTSSIAELSGYNNMGEKIRKNNIFRNTRPSDPASCSYCNFAFCVGGTTIEKAANKTITDISKEYFFDPMGIDAAFGSGLLKNKDLIASLYYADNSLARSKESMAKLVPSNVPGYSGSYMPGGLCISAKDYAKMVCILVNDGLYQGQRYLSEEAVQTMETPFCLTDYHGVQVTQCFPLKYNTNIYGEDGLYFHTGSAYGIYALFSYNPETRNGVVVLTTGASGACDEYGIYSVCGEVSEVLYGAANQLMRNMKTEEETDNIAEEVTVGVNG